MCKIFESYIPYVILYILTIVKHIKIKQWCNIFGQFVYIKSMIFKKNYKELSPIFATC